MPGQQVPLPAGGRAARHHLLRIVPTYLLAVLVAGLVLRAGATATRNGGGASALPWTIAGLGGVTGGIVIAAAALYARRGVDRADVDPVRLARAVTLAAAARMLMFAAAVGTAVAGLLLAPAGGDRNLAIAVNVGLAGLLALFALLANDLSRVACRVLPSHPPSRRT